MSDIDGQIVYLGNVANLLQKNWAYLSGGCSPSGSSIITLPYVEQEDLSEDQYTSLLRYLLSVLEKHTDEPVVVFIIDRRNSDWTAVKTVLNAVFGACMQKVENVFVLRPSGLMTNLFGSLKMKSFKQEHRAKMIVVSSPDDLHRYIDKNQVTSDLDGNLQFNHLNWVEHQMAVESISMNAISARKELNKFFSQLDCYAEPQQTLAELQSFYKRQAVEKVNKIEHLTLLLRQAVELVSHFKEKYKSDIDESHTSSQPHTSRKLHVNAMQRLIVQMEETKEKFDSLWQDHAAKVDDIIKARRMEEKYIALKDTVGKHSNDLGSATLSDCNIYTICDVENHLAAFNLVKKELECGYDEVQRLRIALNAVKLSYCVNSIDINGLEVEFIQCRQLVDELLEQLQLFRKYHEAVSRARDWCDQGMVLLEDDSVSEVFHSRLSDFSASRSSLDDLETLKSSLDGIFTPSLEEMLQQTMLRVNDTFLACNKKHDIVGRQLAAAKKPVLNSAKSAPVGNAKAPHLPPQMSLPRQLTSAKPAPSHDIREVRKIAAFGKQELQHSLDSPLSGLSVVVDCESVRQRRRNVVQELIVTEKTYAQDLEDILMGYAANLDNAEMMTLAPPELHDNRSLLFDNIELIHEFHSGVLLKALESSSESLIDISQCFVHHKDNFFIYTGYCQNKSSAEAVLERIGGDQNPFFVECRQKLKHSLPLSSFLLKPLQRLTKYQLLLRELAGVCTSREEALAMRDAVDVMRHVVQHVNDSMHQLMITGFDGDLSTLGQLLMQGELEVWTDRKSNRVTRHGFLYEKCLLLCKKKKDEKREESTSSHDQIRYNFKNVVQMNRVGLRETVKSGDVRRFELTVTNQGGRSIEVWTMQVSSKELKAEWVANVQKLLIRQLCSIKRKKQRTIADVQDVFSQVLSEEDSVVQPSTVRSDGNNNSNNARVS